MTPGTTRNTVAQKSGRLVSGNEPAARRLAVVFLKPLIEPSRVRDAVRDAVSPESLA